MRGVRNTEDGIEVVDVPDVEPDGDLVRVRVRSAGICGSDLHLIEWGPMPVTLGHEFAGVLDDGTEVAVEPQVPCLDCDRCRAGQVHLCRTLLSRAHGVSIDGGLADEVLVDRRAAVALPAGVRLVDAGLVEPLAVAVHGVHHAADRGRSAGARDRRRQHRPLRGGGPAPSRDDPRPGRPPPPPGRGRRTARRPSHRSEPTTTW